MAWVPYSYGTLRVYCEEEEDLCGQFSWQEPFYLAAEPSSFLTQIEDPAVICFSMYLWNEKLHNQIAALVKKAFPEALIVFGGPSVPNSASSLQLGYNADILVHGEGELPFSAILRRLLGSSPQFDAIDNVSVLNPQFGSAGFKKFSKIPVQRLSSPYLKGIFDKILAKKTPGKAEIIALWEKDRGCPYSCGFCDWPWTGSKMRYRPVEEIFREIHFFAEKKLNDIYMCDANFGLWEKDLDIAYELARVKKATGFPKTLIYSSAKRSDDRVRELSKVLADADMIWGTTLSVQSLNAETLRSIKRVNISPSRFQSFSVDYSSDRVGVYSEVILGLPKETKSSFVRGIGEILESGNHEDIRMFEFFFLPNAPLNRVEEIERYGLDIRTKPLNILSERTFSNESVDIVVGTKDMPIEDWIYCYVFGELIQALHNGGYTRFISIYLNRETNLKYAEFYDDLIRHFLDRPELSLGRIFNRLRQAIEDFARRDDVPTVHKLIWHQDIREQLAKFGPDRKGWIPYQYVWLMMSEDFENAYLELETYLADTYGSGSVGSKNAWNDVIRFQKSMMLRPSYDSAVGKTSPFEFNWFEFFFTGSELKPQASSYTFSDQATGPGHRFSLKYSGEPLHFARAAVGDAYPFSKLRHFCHQPECIAIAPSREVVTSGEASAELGSHWS